MLAISILFTDRHLVAFHKIIFFYLEAHKLDPWRVSPHRFTVLTKKRLLKWLLSMVGNSSWLPLWPFEKPQANFYQVNKSCLWYPWLCLFRLINFSFNLFILLQPTQILVRAKVELVIDAFSKRVKAILPWFLYSDPKLSIINLLILFFLTGRL